MRVAGAIGMAAALAAAGAPAAAQSVKDGVDAWQKADYGAAVRIWRPLAAQGDGDAAFDLAQAYKLGRGVPTDLGLAKTLYGKAARAGHAQGIANYGLLMFQDGDRKAAMPWIAQASEAGDPRAQYVHGTALFNGDLLPKDWPRAYALMTRAAAAGLPQATTSLAQMDRFMPPADRQKGLQLASTLAGKPVPPIGKQLVTQGSAPAPTLTAQATALARPAAVVAATPPRPVEQARSAATPAPKFPKPSAPAKAPPALATGKWQIQLGAYGSEPAAKMAWAKLAGRMGGLSPRYETAGAVVRLRAAGLADRAAAQRACAVAKAAGAACFPVAP